MSTTDEQRAFDAYWSLRQVASWWDKNEGGAFKPYAWAAWQACAAQQASTPAVLSEPAAWIEHHKGGDNLIWDLQKGSPRVTPLYTHPAPSEPAAPVDARDALMNAVRRLGNKMTNAEILTAIARQAAAPAERKS